MYTQAITPTYYQPLSPAEFLNKTASMTAPPVQQFFPVYPVIPPQPVFENGQTYLRMLAFDTYTKGHPDLAISNLEQSIAGKKLDDSDVNTMVVLGRLYREVKQYDKSLNILLQAKNLDNSYTNVLIDPTPPNKINFELGKTYYVMGNLAEAKKYMQHEKILYDVKKSMLRSLPKEDAKDYNELTNILNVQA